MAAILNTERQNVTLKSENGELTKSLNSKDGELKDARQDRDKYQLMLAPFQAMAIKFYTNAPIDQRLDLLASQISSASSNLTTMMEAQRPLLQLFLNNKLITNGSAISLKGTRTVTSSIRNLSPISAEHLKLIVAAPAILLSNINFGANWGPPTPALFFDRAKNEIQPDDLSVSREWHDDDSLAGGTLTTIDSSSLQICHGLQYL